MGLPKGARVGIWAPNRAEWTITQFATAKIGAILVNINPAYRLHELEYALNQSGCAALVTAQRFRTTDYIAMLVTLLPHLRETAVTLEQASPDAPVREMRILGLRHIIRLENPGDPGD